MSQIIIEQLKKSFLFSGLPNEMLEALAQKVNEHQLAKDETLFKRGDEGDSLFVINTGWVKIVTEEADGEELILNQVGPGETIGEMALLDGEPRSAGVVAMADTSVLELKREDFIELLNQHPDLAHLVIRSISSRLRFATTYIQKAIEWSKQIAEGDYSFLEQSPPLQYPSPNLSDQDKAGQLISAFFQMVRDVKQREDDLKQRLEKLTFEIDQSRRKKEVEEIIGSEFYAKLKERAKELRSQRNDR